MKQQSGFTLIELIVVIVVLGILTATALPRFVNLATDARIAKMNEVAGSLRTAAALVNGVVNAENLTSGTFAGAATVTLADGTVVTIAGGYPVASANGIVSAINSSDIYFSYGASIVTFAPDSNHTNCAVTYSQTVYTSAPVVSSLSVDRINNGANAVSYCS
jgi:MSHA pilin protein MshA